VADPRLLNILPHNPLQPHPRFILQKLPRPKHLLQYARCHVLRKLSHLPQFPGIVRPYATSPTPYLFRIPHCSVSAPPPTGVNIMPCITILPPPDSQLTLHQPYHIAWLMPPAPTFSGCSTMITTYYGGRNFSRRCSAGRTRTPHAPQGTPDFQWGARYITVFRPPPVRLKNSVSCQARDATGRGEGVSARRGSWPRFADEKNRISWCGFRNSRSLADSLLRPVRLPPSAPCSRRSEVRVEVRSGQLGENGAGR